MLRSSSSRVGVIAALGLLCMAFGQTGRAPAPGRTAAAATVVEWTTYGGDLASTRYSPLDQINKDNFRTCRSPGG